MITTPIFSILRRKKKTKDERRSFFHHQRGWHEFLEQYFFLFFAHLHESEIENRKRRCCDCKNGWIVYFFHPWAAREGEKWKLALFVAVERINFLKMYIFYGSKFALSFQHTLPFSRLATFFLLFPFFL